MRFIALTPDRNGRWASWGALLGTLTAIIPDQWGELLFVREHMSLAREVVAGGDAAVFLKS
ncbi:MAG: hypothetical protein JKY56_27530, partial [Kofleriaceae bacterium]|nr:hypothetical protein [Kofleriaceae bacterium]